MPFKVSARTLLQLGAELISSDAIAFYELIKNAFDARSRRVEINVVSRIPFEDLNEFRDMLLQDKLKGDTPNSQFVDHFQKQLLSSIISSYPEETPLSEEILKAFSYEAFEKILDEANYIVITDTGEGMSFNDLKQVYLTVGTPSRWYQKQLLFLDGQDKENEDKDPILGEKGVGRLSVMRLGNKLRVRTSKKGEMRWNILEVDWTLFSEVDKFIEEIDVEPEYGELKENKSTSGTTLFISSLISEWSKDKLEKIALHEFSKLTDPFLTKRRYPISLYFNGDLLNIANFDKMVFDWAHATVEAEFSLDDPNIPQLIYTIDYRLLKRKKTSVLQGTHLISVSGGVSSSRALKSLGPFKVKFYWYNRRLINAVEGIGDQKKVRELIARWAGGLMLYRDGFRVNPYGGVNDDWLGIDEKALASPGYKVNRRQIIGKVDISALRNPKLIDQTNREGLRNSEEKQILINLLLFLILELRNFLNQVDNETQAREPVSFGDLEERVEVQEKRIQDNLQSMLLKYPQLKADTEIVPIITDATKKIHGWMKEAKDLAETYEKGHTQIVHLAGLGLMVEILAHELNRATSNTLSTLSDRSASALPSDVRSLFNTLELQLKTLQKRLRILDPLSTSGRQIKEDFDLISWVDEILTSHKSQFLRHNIKYSLQIEPAQHSPKLQIHAVKGMIVQVLENLISNSVYWLKQEKIVNKNFEPEIIVKIDTRTKKIYFTDNGPGIDPSMKENIFQPFVTTKPPGEGKGLGLFISREIATYNESSLYLLDQPTVHNDELNTFVFVIGGDK